MFKKITLLRSIFIKRFKMKFWIFILLGIFSRCSCDSLQRKLITNQASDIGTDWKPLPVKDLHPPPAATLHQGFINLPNPSSNRNKLPQLVHHNNNNQFLRQYQIHHPVFPSQRNHFPSSSILNAPHFPLNIPRYNHLNIQPNIQPSHIFPSAPNNAALIKTQLPLPKALNKPESYSMKTQYYDLKHLQAAATGLGSYGLHTTTAKIPVHHIRPPPFFKSFNNIAIGDSKLLGGNFAASSVGHEQTSPKALLAHQNIITLPAFKKFPVTTSPLSSSFISYAHPLTGKGTNHIQVFHQAPAVTTIRTQITSPDKHYQKHYYLKPQENSINVKVEGQINSVQGPESPSFTPVHHHRHHHQNQDQLLPPVPASVLTPFFVSIQEQDLLNTNKSVKNSEVSSFQSDSELANRNVYSNNNSIQQFLEEFEKSKEKTTTLKSVENSENLKTEDIFYTTTSVSVSSPSPQVNEIINDDFNRVFSTKNTLVTSKPSNHNYHFEEDSNSNSIFSLSLQFDNFNNGGIHSTRNTFASERPFDNYHFENSNSDFKPSQKIEKFNSVFNTPKTKSFNLPSASHVHSNFFTLEDAITIRPFNEFRTFEQFSKTTKTPPNEKLLGLNISNQISPTPTETTRQNYINQKPMRYHPVNRTETFSPVSITSSTAQTFTNEVVNSNYRKHSEKLINHVLEQPSSEKPTILDDNNIVLRRKPHFKNSKRYQSRKNNTMQTMGITSTTASIRQRPTLSSTTTSTTTGSTIHTINNTIKNRPSFLMTMNKVPYSRIPPSLRPILKKQNIQSFNPVINQTDSEEEPLIESTQTTTIPATGLGSYIIPTTLNSNVNLKETLTPTISSFSPSEQQMITHYPITPSTVSQLPSSSSPSSLLVPEVVKRRHRLKNRNEVIKNKESVIPEPERTNSSVTLNQSKDIVKSSTTESVIGAVSSERPKFSIRNYHRQRYQKNTTDSDPVTTTTTTTPIPVPIEISSSTSQHNTNPSSTTRRRLMPSIQLHTHHPNTTEITKRRRRPENRGQTLENQTAKNNRENNSGESSEIKQKQNNRRRGSASDTRRNRYSQRNENTASKEMTSKEIDSSIESLPPTTTKDGLPLIKNISSLLRRPPRISLKERIQNHISRKSNNSTQTHQTDENSDDLLNITLETKLSNTESTTPSSSSTARIESAIMKIAKDDHSHSQRISSSGTTTASSSRSKSSSSHHSSSATKQQSDLSNISRYVDELTASSSSNNLNILNRGLHTRRIPNYFTIATEDPILPIEAFFPNVLKDTNSNDVKENI